MLKDGATYHVTARANRQELILGGDGIKELFIRTLVRAKRKHRFELISVCVMYNHVHLLIRPRGGESLSKIMQWILSVFAINFNKRFGLVGHVWRDRFRSKIIGSLRQFVATLNYIRNNPAKAQIVEHPDDYRYGPERLARDGPPGLLDVAASLVHLLPTARATGIRRRRLLS